MTAFNDGFVSSIPFRPYLDYKLELSLCPVVHFPVGGFMENFKVVSCPFEIRVFQQISQSYLDEIDQELHIMDLWHVLRLYLLQYELVG